MFKIEQNRACYITCVILCYLTYVMLLFNMSCYVITCVVNLLYNTCHVMLYDMFKIEKNRTCYITCVILCYITCLVML